MYPLNQVRIQESPFTNAVKANLDYLLALEPDRLLAPFLNEAGLPKKADYYGNWESMGLAGHTAGHYLSALSDMIASGNDTSDGELNRRLDYMLRELGRCQVANGNGYVGGVPHSKQVWSAVEEGNISAHGFGLNDAWVPLYNIHKTFAGLRDAYYVAGKKDALNILKGFGDWLYNITSHLSDEQMQIMLRSEHGGMNEALADLYVFTKDAKYLTLAKRFNHKAILDPLKHHEDHLTGLHANTQIPKVIGMERIGILTEDEDMLSGAEYFWQNVTQTRSVAFGGNSVSEHFNDPKDFHGMVETREGPETCNTYNMLRLTEMLFTQAPRAEYADYYEEALYNHILASINCNHPGYVYFTPIRPDHYRVYSQPGKGFWCCVGTGMENPGKYGEFIYAKHADGGVWVNLFVPSTLQFDKGTLTQETSFPYQAQSSLKLKLKEPAEFSISLRHPKWVRESEFQVFINGEVYPVSSKPSSYVSIKRVWEDGDVINVKLPMHISTEKLPDGSDWIAFKYGPLVLANPAGTDHLDGLRADDSRMGHVAYGPTVPLNDVPVLVKPEDDLVNYVTPTEKELEFILTDIVEPKAPKGFLLKPFYQIHDQRYQMYWQVLSHEELAAQKEHLRQEEIKRQQLEAMTVDSVAIGEQQPEVEHDFRGEDTQTGMLNGRHWRHGKYFQYNLNTHGEDNLILSLTISGSDHDRVFDVLVDGKVLTSIALNAEAPGELVQKQYPINSELLKNAKDGKLTIAFKATKGLAGGIFDVRLIRTK